MSATFENIRHDGGTHRVEVDIEGDQCVIRFGASFTLRVNEANLNTLREMIHDAARDMAIERRDVSGARDVYDSEEELLYHTVNDSMDKMTERLMQGTADPAGHEYNPNDPANW